MSTNLYSVYPADIKLLNQPLGDYIIAACTPNLPYSITVIEDRDENVSGGSLEGEKQRWTIVTTKSGEIARWLVDEFEHRGVFVSSKDEPTREEIAAAKSKRDAFFKKEFDLASDRWEKDHTRRSITDIARLAAKHMGATPEWLSADAASANRVECPKCAELIKAKASRCHFCGWEREAVAVPPPQGRAQQAAAR